jgi:hypothetical protein
MPVKEDIDLGVMVEGTVELDPMSGRMVVRYEDAKGELQFVDVQERLAAYNGQDVRLLVTPLATVAKLHGMVERGELKLEHVPTVPKLG